MNAFLETLIERLLSNCNEEYSIKDQFSFHDMFIYTPTYNPMERRSLAPKLDFALVKNDKYYFATCQS